MHAYPHGLKPAVLCRVISSQAAVPLIYVPLEAVASKWYGESERNLAEIFRAAEQLGGAIIFLDEIDSLATQRRFLPIPSLKSKPPLLSDFKAESLSIALMCEASEQPIGAIAPFKESTSSSMQATLCLLRARVFASALFAIAQTHQKVFCRGSRSTES